MSFEVYAYLGKKIENLEYRVIQRLTSHGIEVELQPGVDLLSTSSSESLTIAIKKLPDSLKRKEPQLSILVGIGYYSNRNSTNSQEWKPKGVKSYEYCIYTRTSSGQALITGVIQYLITSTIAYESEGKVWVNGEDSASIGKDAFHKALTELLKFDCEVDIGSTVFAGWPVGDQELVWPTEIIGASPPPKVDMPKKTPWWKFWVV